MWDMINYTCNYVQYILYMYCISQNSVKKEFAKKSINQSSMLVLYVMYSPEVEKELMVMVDVSVSNP